MRTTRAEFLLRLDVRRQEKSARHWDWRHASLALRRMLEAPSLNRTCRLVQGGTRFDEFPPGDRRHRCRLPRCAVVNNTGEAEGARLLHCEQRSQLLGTFSHDADGFLHPFL